MLIIYFKLIPYIPQIVRPIQNISDILCKEKYINLRVTCHFIRVLIGLKS